MSIDVERLAKELHTLPGMEDYRTWEDMGEKWREAKRHQARHLLNKYKIEPFSQEVQEAAVRGFSGT